MFSILFHSSLAQVDKDLALMEIWFIYIENSPAQG